MWQLCWKATAKPYCLTTYTIIFQENTYNERNLDIFFDTYISTRYFKLHLHCVFRLNCFWFSQVNPLRMFWFLPSWLQNTSFPIKWIGVFVWNKNNRKQIFSCRWLNYSKKKNQNSQSFRMTIFSSYRVYCEFLVLLYTFSAVMTDRQRTKKCNGHMTSTVCLQPFEIKVVLQKLGRKISRQRSI